MAVSLRKVVDEMDCPEEWRAFLNRRTGEVYSASEDDLRFAEEEGNGEDLPDWQRDEFPKLREIVTSDDWLELPSRFEINEYSLMERFSDVRADEGQRHRLLGAIRGRGAFRRFKDTVQELGIQDEWYRYRDEELRAIAVEWLEAHGIPYTE